MVERLSVQNKVGYQLFLSIYKSIAQGAEQSLAQAGSLDRFKEDGWDYFVRIDVAKRPTHLTSV